MHRSNIITIKNKKTPFHHTISSIELAITHRDLAAALSNSLFVLFLFLVVVSSPSRTRMSSFAPSSLDASSFAASITTSINEPTNSMIPRPLDHRRNDDDNESSSVCAICQHSPRGPLVTQCRHCFCGRCIKALLDNASMRPIDCPVCRSPIFDASELCSPSPSPSASSLGGEEAETRCTNQAHGCSWRGGARDSGAASLSEHLSSTCMHHPCSNRARGCSWVGSMGAAIIHQATECEIDIGNEHQASSSTKSDVDNKAASCRADKTVRAMLSSRVFAIDVGHRTFRATERTLRAERGSVLDRMFSGEYELPRDSYHLGFIDHGHHDDDGGDDVQTNRQRRERRVFIDCDPRSFEHALHWLRAYVSLLLISNNRSLLFVDLD